MIDLSFLYHKQEVFLLLLFAFSTTLLHWWLLLTFNLNKTSLGETRCLGNLYFLLTGCLGKQFFYSPPFSQYSQLSLDFQQIIHEILHCQSHYQSHCKINCQAIVRFIRWTLFWIIIDKVLQFILFYFIFILFQKCLWGVPFICSNNRI